MLFRIALLAVAIAELLWPRRLVDFWMNVAAEGDQEVELHSWVYTIARLEGVVILLWLLARRRRDRTRDEGT